ncbi:MAG: DIP1984 family protein [Solobacterium sp.]|nr:DIP1984 family protein [Solobacterium sp.]
MKLAEALQERADLNRKIEQLRTRINNNVLMQEGEKPAEDPGELIAELNASLNRLQELIALINLKNALVVHNGKTLTELLAERDILTKKISVYQDMVETASENVQRARMSEIRILSAVNVRELQQQTDAFSKQLRLLDNTIQEINWTTEL